MSFLLDKALLFAKHGPFGPKPETKEEYKLQSRMLALTKSYRKIVWGWMQKGVSKKQLIDRGLWFDELLQAQIASMGGGGGLPGLPLIPILTPGSPSGPPSTTNPAYVEEEEKKVARVEQANEAVTQAGAVSSQATLAAIDESLSGVESKTQHPARVEAGTWQALFPELLNNPGGQFIHNGFNTRRGTVDPDTGEIYTTDKLKKIYMEGIRSVRGHIVDANQLRDVIIRLIAQKRGYTDESELLSQAERTALFRTQWGESGRNKPSANYLRNQEILLAFNALGIRFPVSEGTGKGSPKEMAKEIETDSEKLMNVLYLLGHRFPQVFIVRDADMRAALIPEEPVERPASTREWIEQRLEYLRGELKENSTGMDSSLINSLTNQILSWADTYPGILRGENPDMTDTAVQSEAIMNLVSIIRKAAVDQKKKDGSFYLSSDKIMKIVVEMLRGWAYLDPRGLRDSIDEKEGALVAVIKHENMDPDEKSQDNITLANRVLGDLGYMRKRANSIVEAINKIRTRPVPEGTSESLQDVANPEDISYFEKKSKALLEAGKNAPGMIAEMKEAVSEAIAKQAASSHIIIRARGVAISAFNRIRGSPPGESKSEEPLEYDDLDEIRAREEREYMEEDNRLRRWRVLNSIAKTIFGEPIAEDIEGGSPGGGPPDGGPPGGDYFAVAVDGAGGRRIYGASRGELSSLLLKIAQVISTIGGAAFTIKEVHDWVRDKLSGAETGTVIIDIDKGKPKPTNPKTRNKEYIGPNSGVPNIPSNGMTDTATYEMGIDGKPKMFPQPSSAKAYNGPIPPGAAIPWAPKMARYQVKAPAISQPGGTITEKDQLGGFDTENDEIIRLMADRPEIGAHIEEYNKNVDLYNDAIMSKDKAKADSLRAVLKRQSQEITGEANLTSSFAGLGDSVKDIPHAVYNGNTISGGYGTFYAHKTKNAQTARLGLDKDIDEYNYLVDRINSDTYQERTPLAGLKTDIDQLNRKINGIEIAPEMAIGVSRPRYISEKYPAEVRELADAVLRGEAPEIDARKEQLLKQYPEVGNPVIKYVEFRKHYPKGAKPPADVQKDLDSLWGYKELNYNLPQSREFAEGPHEMSPVLKKLIDRVAAATPESRKNFILTKEEKEELRRYPDIEAKFLDYEEAAAAFSAMPMKKAGHRAYMAETPLDNRVSIVENLAGDLQRAGYKAREGAGYSMAELDERIAQDKIELQNAYMNFKTAQQAGASRSDLAVLYQKYNVAKSRYAADSHEAAGRGTYLADRSRELLPQNEAELKEFQRLQDVEGALQDRPDVLLAYNKSVSELPMGGMSPAEYYQKRLELLRLAASEAGATTAYDDALSRAGQPMDETIISIPDDARATEQQGEGTERAGIVDPDEQMLFMMSGAQNEKQFKNWLKFSYVAPGYGLGGPAQNILQRQNVLSEARRFANASKVATRSRPVLPRPVEDPMRHQQLIDPCVSSFGKVHMKDAFHDNYLDMAGKKVIWSNPYGDINSTREVRQRDPIYDPDYTDFRYDELTNTRFGRHAVPIGEVSKPAEYRFTNERYYDTNGFNYKQQNELNLFPADGGRTMITKDRAGLDDRGIIEEPNKWHYYGRTRLRAPPVSGFRSTRL